MSIHFIIHHGDKKGLRIVYLFEKTGKDVISYKQTRKDNFLDIVYDLYRFAAIHELERDTIVVCTGSCKLRRAALFFGYTYVRGLRKVSIIYNGKLDKLFFKLYLKMCKIAPHDQRLDELKNFTFPLY